jgi:hypothetical protein
MKSIFYLFFICSYLLAAQGLFAQTSIDFTFQISRNSVNLGTFTGTASTASIPHYVTTNPMLAQLCPGDELVIRQTCVKNGVQLNFNTSSWATIALTNTTLLGAGASPIGSVCPSPSPCITGTPNFGSWSYNTTVTVTIPSAPTNDNYLAVSNNIFGNTVCGIVAFIPINVAPTTSIADQTICPGDAVSIPLTSGFTYSNWAPNNPSLSGNAPTTTANYTVDIQHATGCAQSYDFTISVSNPEVELSLPRGLCYNQSMQFTEDDFYTLYGNGSTTPLTLTANGATIFDFDNNNIFNLPYLIDGPTLGSGIITFVYTYIENGLTCSKTYSLTIHPEIVLNMQSVYTFCNSNFQPIFATSNGILGQSGISYIWTQTGVPFSVGSGPFFTPSSYGTYHVRAYDEAGCVVRHTFVVSDPGVGIKHPANLTFCSMTQHTPGYIGWSSDPFGAVLYSFTWTYTNVGGSTMIITNSGAQYQVPYLGPGTYTTVVNANGCTETISIIVTDLIQTYTNNSNADFSFTPLAGNQVSCQPVINMSGVSNVWTVVDQYGVTISTIPYLSGIRFPYLTGVEYSVTLKRSAPRQCQIFINEFTWLDEVNKNRDNNSRSDVSDNNSTLNFEPTTVSTFPNPTTGLVNIKLEDAETTETNIKVLNALGQVVLEKQVQNNTNIEVDLSNEISGIYIVHIVNGATQFTGKVIKE